MSVGNNAYLAFGTIGIAAYSLEKKTHGLKKNEGVRGRTARAG